MAGCNTDSVIHSPLHREIEQIAAVREMASADIARFLGTSVKLCFDLFLFDEAPRAIGERAGLLIWLWWHCIMTTQNAIRIMNWFIFLQTLYTV